MKRLNPATGEPFRQGDVREDGYVFDGYTSQRRRPDGSLGERWLRPENFAKYRKNPEYERRNTVRKHGISPEDYDSILAHQSGVCAICGGSTCSTGRKLAVDHDHASGAVRGLLCKDCNTALGQMHDDTERLRAAIAYLEAGGSGWNS